MPFDRIVLLAGKWDTTPIVYNFLQSNFHVETVILEQKVARKQFLRRRIKKLGWLNVLGQLLFQLFVARPLSRFSRARIEEIKAKYRLNNADIPAEKIFPVMSVNSDTTVRKLQLLQPDLVVVHGTRIISKSVLQSTGAQFINIHAGITPRYRGSHGGYWAIANNDEKNCGVTVHLIDAGIDTGKVLAQAPILVTRKDNFSTYPYLQLAEGLNLLRGVIKQLESGGTPGVKNELNSALWHHPTLWGYLWRRLRKGVK